MQFGIRAHDLGKLDFLTLTTKLSEMEIQNIQLAFYKAINDIDFTVGNFSHGLCSHISSNLVRHNINISVLGCYINPVNTNEAELNKAVEQFKEYLKYGKFLKAGVVGTETGRAENLSDIEREKQYQRFLTTMEKIKYDAERLGVFFGVEGVANDTLQDSKTIKRFFKDIDSPNALAIYDPVNLISATEASNNEIGKNIEACFSDFGNRIAVVHLKDFTIKDDLNGNKIKVSSRIGEGIMDFERLFYYLKRKKPHITCLLEESNEQKYFEDIHYLKSVISSI